MAGSWRLARSLETLRDQVNVLYPGRNKASDGTIGDAAHAVTESDHNPNAQGVVTALDLTHDPAHGLDIEQLAQALIDSRDPRIKYLIFNRQIVVPSSSTGWRPRGYSGDNPHTKHIHISVWGNYDDKTNWRIDGMDWKAKFLEAEKIADERLRALGIKDQEIADRQKRIDELYALAEDRLKAIRIYEQKEKDGGDINTKLDKIIKKLGA